MNGRTKEIKNITKPIQSEDEDETESESETETEDETKDEYETKDKVESSVEDLLYGLLEQQDGLPDVEDSLASSGSFFQDVDFGSFFQDRKLALEVIDRLKKREFPFHILFDIDRFYCDSIREVLFEIYKDNKQDEDDAEILYLMGYFLVRQLAEQQTSIQCADFVLPPASLDSLMEARQNQGKPLLTVDQLFFIAQYYHTGPEINLERACKYYQLAIDVKPATGHAVSVAALQKIAREHGGIAYFYLGQCYQYGYLTGKEENAVTCYEKIKSISAGAAFYLGECYFRLGEWNAAVAAYEYCWMQHGADNEYSKHALAALQSIHPKKRLHEWCDFLTQQHEGPIDFNEIGRKIEQLSSFISAYLGKLGVFFLDRKLAIDFLWELKKNNIDPEHYAANEKTFFGSQTKEILLGLQEKYPCYKDHDEVLCLIDFCKKWHIEKSSTMPESKRFTWKELSEGKNYTALKEKIHEAGLESEKEKEAYRQLREEILPTIELICTHLFWQKDSFLEKVKNVLTIVQDKNKIAANKYNDILETIKGKPGVWARLHSKKLSENARTLIDAIKEKNGEKLETLQKKMYQGQNIKNGFPPPRE